MRPVGSYHAQPLVDLATEEAVLGMNLAAELVLQAAWGKNWHTDVARFEHPTSPGDPDIEIKNSGRVGERDHDLPFHWNAVLVDLRVKGFAQGDSVRAVMDGKRRRFAVFGEPEMNFINEVKTRPVNQMAAARLVLCSEKDGGSKAALEALHHTPVVAAILGEAEELQHLRSAIEMDGAVLLPEGEGRHPNRNKAVLAEGQTEVGMSDDMKEEIPVAALVKELLPGEGT